MSMSPAPESKQWHSGRRSVTYPNDRAVPFVLRIVTLVAMIQGGLGVGIAAYGLSLWFLFDAATFSLPDAPSYAPREYLVAREQLLKEGGALLAKRKPLLLVVDIAALIVAGAMFIQAGRCWRLRPMAHHGLAYTLIAALMVFGWSVYLTISLAVAMTDEVQKFEDRLAAAHPEESQYSNSRLPPESPEPLVRRLVASDFGIADLVVITIKVAQLAFFLGAASYLFRPGLDHYFGQRR
jgi:hypothetical protein